MLDKIFNVPRLQRADNSEEVEAQIHAYRDKLNKESMLTCLHVLMDIAGTKYPLVRVGLAGLADYIQTDDEDELVECAALMGAGLSHMQERQGMRDFVEEKMNNGASLWEALSEYEEIQSAKGL